jgi:hypothetical protein
MAKIDLIRRPSLISPRHLLRYIFFTEMQVDQASYILNTIMKNDGVVKDSDWQSFRFEFRDEKNKAKLSSRGLYVKVMRKLRDVGLVEKRMGEFRLAEDFSKAMTRLADYWSQIVKSYSEGDRSIEF